MTFTGSPCPMQETTHGEADHNQDPPELVCGNGPLLRDQEKRADDDGKDVCSEVRPRRAQARRVQRRQDQVSLPVTRTVNKKPRRDYPEAAFFVSRRSMATWITGPSSSSVQQSAPLQVTTT